MLIIHRKLVFNRRIDVESAIQMRAYGFDVMRFAVDADYRKWLVDREGIIALVDALYCHYRPELSPRAFAKLLPKPGELFDIVYEAVNAFFLCPMPPSSGATRNAKAEDLWHDIYRLAGEVGVNPLPLTYGELVAMADGRRKAEWARTACLRADVINGYAKRPISPAKCDATGGLSDRRVIEITPETLSIFKQFAKNISKEKR